MLKYCLSAAALRAFSFSPLTRRMYRQLGNTWGARKRSAGRMPAYYPARINRMLRIARTYGAPKDGDRLIELGTGWLHWEAITTRLFFDVRCTLFDVWDNRQIDGLKNYLGQLDGLIDQLDASQARRARARQLISKINAVRNYPELYDLLSFEYVLDQRGNLSKFRPESFDVAVSAGVLEHIYAKDAPAYVNGIAALLKPGGYSIHSINIRDHLYQYDRSVSRKQYLRYPPWIWGLCFENDVQYINRIQRPEWRGLFEEAGLAIVEEEVESEDLSGLRIAASYSHYAEADLRCGGLKLVHRKSF